eukprot:gene34592-46427_t
MISYVRSTVAAATLSLILATFAFAAPADEPGYIDLGRFTPAAQGQFVEVNISTALIKFAARLAKAQESEVAQVLGSLKSVRVNVVGLDDANRRENLALLEAARRKLDSSGWAKVVTVREPKGDNVDVHVLQKNDDVIEGLVVTVIDRKGEAVFVNIVGSISADQIGLIAEKFQIEPLRKLKLPAGKA